MSIAYHLTVFRKKSIAGGDVAVGSTYEIARDHSVMKALATVLHLDDAYRLLRGDNDVDAVGIDPDQFLRIQIDPASASINGIAYEAIGIDEDQFLNLCSIHDAVATGTNALQIQAI